jgi:hypothetical protein
MLPDAALNRSRHTIGSLTATNGRHLARKDRVTAQLHRDWLKSLPDRTGKSLTRIADEIGIARTTLTRPVKKGDEGISTLHASTIEKVARHLGVAPPDLGIDETPPRPARRSLAEEAIPFVADNGGDLAAAVRALIGDRRNADPWIIKSRALETAGFLPGDIVIVDLNATPRAGDAVCAQVFDWQRGTAETIMRLFQPPYLVAATFDETLRKPFVVDDDQVIVKGVLLPHRLKMPVK